MQVDCILPGVLSTLPASKRRELAKLWHVNTDKPRESRPFRTRASETVNFVAASGEATATATQEAAVAAEARGTRNSFGLGQPDQARIMEELQQQQQQRKKQRQKRGSVVATRGGRQEAKGQV